MDIKTRAIDLFESALEEAPSIIGGLFLTGVAGLIAPGAVNVMLAYQQKRQERIYEAFMREVKSRMAIIDDRLSRLSEDALIDFKDKYFGMVSDYALEEVQEEKVKYLATGLVNLSGTEEVNEDFVLTYYDTLRDLRMHDIAILRHRYNGTASDYTDILAGFDIDYEQGRAIQEKLERMGLVTTRRSEKEDALYSNLDTMQEYITALAKGKKAKLKSLKKLEKRDTYKISKYGRSFVEFFMKIDSELID